MNKSAETPAAAALSSQGPIVIKKLLTIVSAKDVHESVHIIIFTIDLKHL